jgi:hypothetical protein
MKVIDQLEASIGAIIVPDDMENLPPARLRRLRDSAYIVMKACDRVLAQRVYSPGPTTTGVLANLKNGKGRQ